MSTAYGFMCECTDRQCRLKVRLTDEQYFRLRRRGAVVNSSCRDAYQAGRIVERGVGYVILTTSTARVAA